MDEILEILSKDARVTPQEIAKLIDKPVETVKKTIRQYENSGVIVNYKAVINPELLEGSKSRVRALIEVSITPQKNVGFDYVAERIYSFPEVTADRLEKFSKEIKSAPKIIRQITSQH